MAWLATLVSFGLFSNFVWSACLVLVSVSGTPLVLGPSAVLVGQGVAPSSIVEEFVCFNTILEILCSVDSVIVFDSARYGRNDSALADRCEVPYTRNCDIDVHFSLNRACAGKQRCSMAVNTAFFGDPCGYDEFLKVVYRCVKCKSNLFS